MKKFFALLLALSLVLGLCACSSTEKSAADVEISVTGDAVKKEAPVDKVADVENFPIVGSWINESGKNCLRFNEDGSMLMEAVAKTTKNETEKSFAIYQDSSYSWSAGEDKIFVKSAEYTPVVNGDTYKLVGEKVTYIRVGDLDYELDMRFDY